MNIQDGGDPVVRNLVIETGDDRGMVQIEPRHSLHDVRQLIQEEFDDEMIPQPDFYFVVGDGVRVMRKQESRYKAMQYLGDTVKLLPTKAPRQAAAMKRAPDGTDLNQTPAKKTCSPTVAITVTPTVEHSDRGAAIAPGPSIDRFSCSTPEAADDVEESKKPSAKALVTACHSTEEVGGDEEQGDEHVFMDENSDNSDIDEEPTVAREDDNDVGAHGDSGSHAKTIETEWHGGVHEITSGDEMDSHQKYDQAVQQSRSVIAQIGDLLDKNPDFCSPSRREEWKEEIAHLLEKKEINTIIGMLGSTGVGKSSLLNALLDEAAVLPTSGSRGCTATVVELRFNRDLLFERTDLDAPIATTAPVYKGEIEFIALSDWQLEVDILVSECCMDESDCILKKPPEARKLIAFAAWQKLNQVYGHGTMETFHGKPKGLVYDVLANDRRVVELLISTDPSSQHKSVAVREGNVSAKKAKKLLRGFSQLSDLTKKQRQESAGLFRDQINEFVYRKGNGDEPQTWPLIRKVVLEGPWPVLSSGACLVDLPGKGDANVARAKVSEAYMKNCDKTWIVAPIKRAVDDRTAKTLMGEQFKRRLLMDGAYGHVSFICTQTDDCEATETMRDHKDVAIKLGCWGPMHELSKLLESVNNDLSILRDKENELDDLCKKQRMMLISASKMLVKYDEAMQKEPSEVLEKKQELLRSQVAKFTDSKRIAEANLKAWKVDNQARVHEFDKQKRAHHLKLKCNCALVRNSYSKERLKDDFKAGLEELLQEVEDDETEREDDAMNKNKSEDETKEAYLEDCDDEHDEEEEKDKDESKVGDEGVAGKEQIFKQDDAKNGSTNAGDPVNNNKLREAQMPVFCVSANDYLKIEGIKGESDGPPSTFTQSRDTQIPLLASFVHQTTSKYRKFPTEAFVNQSASLLDRVKMVAIHGGDALGAQLCQATFEEELCRFDRSIQPIVVEFREAMHKNLKTLQPSLLSGASQAEAIALSVVNSWGSKSRRSILLGRSPENNGVHYITYHATIRRKGAFESRSAGSIDFNQELVDPMEKEISAEWQRVMDSSVISLLQKCESQVLEVCCSVGKTLASEFIEAGMPVETLTNMAKTCSRSCVTSVKGSFQEMSKMAKDTQRDLNRSLLDKIRKQMEIAYESATEVEGGQGRFQRMKNEMTTRAEASLEAMFDLPTKELLDGIDELVGVLSKMISALSKRLQNTMKEVYTVYWDDQGQIPAHVRKCRDSLLPKLLELCKEQRTAMDTLSIEQTQVDLDLTAVATWEDSYQQKLHEAETNGNFVDLTESDVEDWQDQLPPEAFYRPNQVVSSEF